MISDVSLDLFCLGDVNLVLDDIFYFLSCVVYYLSTGELELIILIMREAILSLELCVLREYCLRIIC